MKTFSNKLATFMLPFIFIIFLFIIFSPNLFKTKKQNKLIYAESITINNLPREINMHIDNSLVFTNNPCKIIPENCNMPITVKILTNLGRPKEGGQFKNNTFTATHTGLYYLRFCVQSSRGTTLHDTIKVNVVHDINTATKIIKVNTRIRNIYLDETTNLLNMVSIYNFDKENITFTLNNKTFSNNIFTPTNIGSYNITINAQADGYALTDTLIVNVHERPSKSIMLYDANYNLIDNTKPYMVELASNQLILTFALQGITEQIIECVLNNNNLSKFPCDSPFIILNLHSVGETTLTIYADNRNLTYTLTIIIV